MLASTLLAVCILVGRRHVVRAQISGTDGWYATESDFACNKTELGIYNATGSRSVSGFSPPGSLTNASLGTIQTLTFTTGVIDFLESTNLSQHTTAQNFWVTAGPEWVDLASPDMPYAGWTGVISGLPRQVYVNGYNDSGDCTTLFNQACVDALLAQAKNVSLGFITHPGNPVKDAIIWPPPSACSQFTSGGNWLAYIGSVDTYIGNNSGPADFPYCNTNGAVFGVPELYVGDQQAEPLGTYNGYDEAVTEIMPLVTAVWSKDTNTMWSDARLVCLRPTSFRLGSRVTTTVPSAGVRTRRVPEWLFSRNAMAAWVLAGTVSLCWGLLW